MIRPRECSESSTIEEKRENVRMVGSSKGVHVCVLYKLAGDDKIYYLFV